MSKANEIVIENGGAIERLVIPINPKGGLSVVKGRNGAGKSTALECVQGLLTNKNPDVELRDSAPVGAKATIGWGEARLTFGRGKRMTGELECKHLEGKLDLATLVDPGYEDPEASDLRRIRALVALSGSKAGREKFEELLGGKAQYEALISSKAATAKDVIELARIVKQDLQLAARKQEDAAINEEGRAASCGEAPEGLNLEAESDADKLNKAVEDAVAKNAKIKEQAAAAERDRKRVAEAKAALDKTKAEHKGKTVADAKRTFDATNERRENIRTALAEARKALEDCEKALAICDSDVDRDWALLEAARRHEESIAGWQKTIEEAMPEPPSQGAIAEAEHALVEARKAAEAGVLIRQVKRRQAERVEHIRAAESFKKQAKRLRDLADATDEVVAECIESPIFSVRDGRLLVKHQGRAKGECFYDELSVGERWKIAIDLGVDRLERESVGADQRLLTIPQEGFDGLSPENRDLIHKHAQDRGVPIIVAQADDGPLRAELYGEPSDAVSDLPGNDRKRQPAV